ncbi:hypothetical protein DEJ13_06050 [Curtobacterium sp. MCLR17_007]|uniref:hypothetical protein n=1 Tax=Curtobacterium sp. MCLR17_007 TaxID=2175648 RepID=UPI000DAA51C6|nr:hypothetical protein [Curtobacterium sp. MCLR17_007]WIB61391.1 hypothetical protein DEJ13_06050 [Curtobacterium sp. MCLR17_007]
MAPLLGPTRTAWIAAGGAVVAGVVAISVLLSVPVPNGRSTPQPLVADAPSSAAATATPPPLDQPWYRTGLPVDGEIIPIGAETVGHVSVARIAERSVRVTITGFSTDRRSADMRVQLTGGDVVGTGADAEWIPDGDPVEVGVIPHGASSVVIDLRTPQILPPSVHSLVVLDWNTTTILGGAELLPST